MVKTNSLIPLSQSPHILLVHAVKRYAPPRQYTDRFPPTRNGLIGGEDPKMTITSDHRSLAGVPPPATHSTPASILSPELSYLSQSCLPMRARSIGTAISSGQTPFCRRRTTKKMITSDYRGFAGVQPPHHAHTSGQHSLVGGVLAGATTNSDER